MPPNTPLRPAPPTKRQHQTRSTQGKGFKVQFTFIDGAKPKEQRKKSRSHVTTQHYRRKRYEKAHANEDSEPSTAPPTIGLTPVVPLEPILIAGAQQRESFDAPTLPIPYYARGRGDPFAGSTLPIPVTPSIHKLVDHYCYVIPSLMQRHWSRPTRRARSAWDLFDLYRRDALSFTGILHHASKHLEGMHRVRSETASTTTWKLHTISGIQARLTLISDNPTSTDFTTDGLLIAIGLLANAERLWGDRHVARIHWGAVKRMLRARGGFASLTGNPTMHTKLLWSYIALTGTSAYLPHDPDPAYVDDFGVAGMSVPFPSSSSSTSASAAAATATIPTDAALSLSTDEFTHLIRVRISQDAARTRRLHRQHHHHLASGTPAPLAPTPSDTLAQHMSPGTPLYACLAPDEPRYAHPDKRRAHENCRMACLLLLNIVVAELSDQGSAVAAWFADLAAAVDGDGNGDDAGVGPEHLLWVLLSEGFGGGYGEGEKQGEGMQCVWERGWKVGRLQGVAKRLGAEWWRAVGGGLWGLLVGSEEMMTLGQSHSHSQGQAQGQGAWGWWDAEAFAEEVRNGGRWVGGDGESGVEAGTCYLGTTNCLLWKMRGESLCSVGRSERSDTGEE